MTVKASAVNLKEKNLHWLFLEMWAITSLLIVASKSLLMAPRKLMGWNCDRDYCSLAFLKTEQIPSTDFGKILLQAMVKQPYQD